MKDDVPDRLEVRLGEGGRGWLANVFIKLFLTSVLCVFLRSWNAELALIPAVIVSILWIARDIRRHRGLAISFTVTGRRVHVERPGGALDLTLEQLEDVQPDTKAASKSVAATQGVHRPLGMATTSSLAVDVSRIQLVLGDDQTIVLDDEFIAHSLCTDHLRTIRLFLRKHGWKPLDERS